MHPQLVVDLKLVLLVSRVGIYIKKDGLRPSLIKDIIVRVQLIAPLLLSHHEAILHQRTSAINFH